MSNRKICSLAAITLALLLAAYAPFAWYSWGPSNRIHVSPESTYIVEPLTAEGSVDYPAALLAKLRHGVEPADNAAIPFLRAMWPAGMSAEDQALICQELGMDPPTKVGFIDWAQSSQAAQFQSNSGDPKSALTAARDAPWRRDDCPLLATWLDDQATSLDELRLMTQRSHFYFPSPALLRENDTLLCQLEYPHLVAAREVAQALSARAMLAIGEQRAIDAWNDIEVCFELARVPSPHGHVIEQLVAFAILQNAELATLSLVTSETCDQHLLEQIADRIDQQPTESLLSTSLEYGSTYQALQIAQRMSQSRDAAQITAALEIDSRLLSNYEWLPYNRNSMSMELNRLLQLHRDVYVISDLAERYAAAKKNGEILDEQAANVLIDEKENPTTYDPSARGILVARSISPLVVDPLLITTTREIIVQQRIRLLQVAIALEQYRRAKQEYPASLELLSKYMPDEALRDPFADGFYRYERRGDGYLLYSQFVNQQDDGGTDMVNQLNQGEYDDDHKLPMIWDGDVAIRTPLRPSRFRSGS